MKKLLLALAVFAGLPAAAQAQDAAAGKAAFAVCRACHQIGEGAKSGVGPMLNGVVGRKSGAVEGFNYSEAMKGANLVWDEANLSEYIANPKAKVAGNKMVYAGQKDEQKLKDLIAFLKLHDNDGKPGLPQ
jgi:cytochrome c